MACSSKIVFQLQVIDKSYRQVLTPVNNSQLLLKLEILDKIRLVTFHTTETQRKCHVVTGSYQFRRNESSHDLDSQCVKMKMLVTQVCHSLDATKLQCFAVTLWNNLIITCLSSLILCTVLGLGDSTVASHHPVFVDRQSGTNAGIVGRDWTGVDVVKLFFFRPTLWQTKLERLFK